MANRYDAVIIGAGHNGLVCAFYLARAGLKVRIVERRDVVGGAAAERAPHPRAAGDVHGHPAGHLVALPDIVHPRPERDGMAAISRGGRWQGVAKDGQRVVYVAV